ncbi:SDR family NAD(P)-dependent oxidoreductase [Nocardia sp. NPDC051750]|uniref:SDR family NAD(P)-dependent oxidoreductase n=1 Tax=Nocardia sp. NPDC051750 TaxID=3364325 RepID=UPI0037A2D02C
MNTRLQGRTALVTGSTSNIGRAIALAFAAEGAHVVVSGRDRGRGDEVVTTIREAGGRADFVSADLDGSAERSHRLAEQSRRVLGGRIDILVNNAGIYPPVSTVSARDEDFDRVYGVNVKAAFFLVQAVAPAMIEAGGGVVINLGSWVARVSVGVGGLYASSKAAVESLTRAWSAEFGTRGIRVNALSPGVIRDPALDPAADFPGEHLMRNTPAGAPGHPDAIAAAAVYLASDEAAFVHGTVLDVDGGRVNVAEATPIPG